MFEIQLEPTVSLSCVVHLYIYTHTFTEYENRSSWSLLEMSITHSSDIVRINIASNFRCSSPSRIRMTPGPDTGENLKVKKDVQMQSVASHIQLVSHTEGENHRARVASPDTNSRWCRVFSPVPFEPLSVFSSVFINPNDLQHPVSRTHIA